MENKAINAKYVLVEKLLEVEEEGFKTVQVQDEFVYKGKIKQLPANDQYSDDQYISNHALTVGDIIIWAKYSPDTHEIGDDKFVLTSDILAVINK